MHKKIHKILFKNNLREIFYGQQLDLLSKMDKMTKLLQTDCLVKIKDHLKRGRVFLLEGEVDLRKTFMDRKERKDKNHNTLLTGVI